MPWRRHCPVCPNGRKEIIDFHLAASEGAAERQRFLDRLYRRGLTGDGLQMICVDGGQGLLAALPAVYPTISVQRCGRTRSGTSYDVDARIVHVSRGLRFGLGI